MSELEKAARMALEALELPVYTQARANAAAALRDALNKQNTHASGCWSWGPAHYECACKELAKAKGWVNDAKPSKG